MVLVAGYVPLFLAYSHHVCYYLSQPRLWSIWSVWSVCCDCSFNSVCPEMEQDKKFMEASWWERLTLGESRSCPDGWLLLSKPLIQFFVDGWCCVPSPLFTLKKNYCRGNEDNILLQKDLCRYSFIQCPWPFGKALLTHVSTRNSRTFTGKCGSVSCGDTVPLSWILVHTMLCVCPPRVYFPSPLEDL